MSAPFGPEQQRIGNQQREEAITSLNDHFALARLDITEYQTRVNRASDAQTYAELAELFRDLPHPHPPFLAPPSVPFAAVPPPPQPTQPYAPPQFNTGAQYNVPPPPPGMGYANPMAPYGYDPITGIPYSDKSKIVAGLLQLFLGHFGVGRFYMGDTGLAVAQLLTCGGCGVWALIDGIIILINGGTDREGRVLKG